MTNRLRRRGERSRGQTLVEFALILPVFLVLTLGVVDGARVFTAYIAIKQGRPGEAKHVIPIVLGVDHYLKLVIVVDDDVDVFDESDVMWAVATRMQADRDLVVIGGSLGAMLDPSADDRGVTAKLGIDATRPFGQPFGEKLVMDPAKMAWARALVDRLGG